MTSPNFENIDLWLFDYVEGNLSVYQKELLENYILNHPELEIDLDMWNMAKTPITETFEHDFEVQKKKESRYAYYTTSLIGAIIILLIGKSNELYNHNLVSSIKHQTTDLELIKNKKETKNYTYEVQKQELETALVQSKTVAASLKTQASQKIANAGFINIKTRTTRQESGQESFEWTLNSTNRFMTSAEKELKENVIDVLSMIPLTLPLQLKGELNIKSHAAVELTETTQISNKKSFTLAGLGLNTKLLFNKIDKVLSKSIAFSNYRDHFYIIPGIASNNVNLSSTGSTSQARFFSTSRVRWFGTSNEKLSQEISVDGYSRSIRSGIGAQVNYDTYADGTIQDWNAAFVFSPKIALSRNISLEPVARLKIGNKVLDASKVQNNSMSFYNNNNPQIFNFDTTQNIGRKLWYRDLDAGFTVNTKVLYIGFQAENLLNHVENLYQNEQNTSNTTPTTYSVIAGTQYLSRNEKLSFHPYVYMRSNINRTTYYTGFSFDLDKVFIGASYGTGAEYSGSVGLSLDRFAFLIQTTNAYQPELNQNLFTHQLTLRINSPMSKKTRRYITL